jgi:hypothetical protein
LYVYCAGNAINKPGAWGNIIDRIDTIEAFIVLYSWQTNGGYIFMNGRLDAVVYTDDESPGTISFKSKSKRVPPKLLIRKWLNENQQADLIRMALVCKLFAQITAVDARTY